MSSKGDEYMELYWKCMCWEWRGTMTAGWKRSGSLKEKWDGQRSHGEEQWKKVQTGGVSQLGRSQGWAKRLIWLKNITKYILSSPSRRTITYGSTFFFLSLIAYVLLTWAINQRAINMVCILQYTGAPRAQLVRGNSLNNLNLNYVLHVLYLPADETEYETTGGKTTDSWYISYFRIPIACLGFKIIFVGFALFSDIYCCQFRSSRFREREREREHHHDFRTW